ncbi:MAG: hypothetical protein MUD14_10815 [Hydrococcus sp. Prado102]|jgi:hypothetical protein|nr:hypothetical protein [Hydrococcus sp. Prado102]
MQETPPGQMTWKPDGAPESGILHLRHYSSESWRPYTEFPEYVVPDPPKDELSEGYATFLALLKKQWQLV